jgi:hypothetical protein
MATSNLASGKTLSLKTDKTAKPPLKLRHARRHLAGVIKLHLDNAALAPRAAHAMDETHNTTVSGPPSCRLAFPAI